MQRSTRVEKLAIEGIHGEVRGSGPPLVLTHDGLLHSESWDAQFRTFARDHRVARWDRRGYGQSPRPTEAYSNVDDLAAVVAATSDAPAALVGASFGGFVSVQCALDHPQLVSALVLVGPFITGLPVTDHFHSRGGRGRPGVDQPTAEQITYWSEVDPWFVAPDNTSARERLRSMLTRHPDNLRPPVELERRPERTAFSRLGEISVPTLVMTGEHDIADVHAHAGVIEAAITGATRVVVPDSGHLPHLETPERFNTIVLDFLAEAHHRDRREPHPNG